MKKKIKNLTPKEKSKICSSYTNNCTNCPLYFGSSDFESYCYLNVDEEFLNKEIEVEDDE